MNVVEFMGMQPTGPKVRNTVEDRAYREASPITHVTAKAAPILLIHGDADTAVPLDQSEIMEKHCRRSGCLLISSAFQAAHMVPLSPARRTRQITWAR